MEDVIVTKPMIGLTAMQACVIKSLSDEEILEKVNTLNQCGTENGWVKVIRDDSEGKNCLPVQCTDYKYREHLIILC